MPFCCIQHLSDVQAIFPAFAANSIVPVATILHVHCIAYSWLMRDYLLFRQLYLSPELQLLMWFYGKILE